MSSTPSSTRGRSSRILAGLDVNVILTPSSALSDPTFTTSSTSQRSTRQTVSGERTRPHYDMKSHPADKVLHKGRWKAHCKRNKIPIDSSDGLEPLYTSANEDSEVELGLDHNGSDEESDFEKKDTSQDLTTEPTRHPVDVKATRHSTRLEMSSGVRRPNYNTKVHPNDRDIGFKKRRLAGPARKRRRIRRAVSDDEDEIAPSSTSKAVAAAPIVVSSDAESSDESDGDELHQDNDDDPNGDMDELSAMADRVSPGPDPSRESITSETALYPDHRRTTEVSSSPESLPKHRPSSKHRTSSELYQSSERHSSSEPHSSSERHQPSERHISAERVASPEHHVSPEQPSVPAHRASPKTQPAQLRVDAIGPERPSTFTPINHTTAQAVAETEEEYLRSVLHEELSGDDDESVLPSSQLRPSSSEDEYRRMQRSLFGINFVGLRGSQPTAAGANAFTPPDTAGLKE